MKRGEVTKGGDPGRVRDSEQVDQDDNVIGVSIATDERDYAVEIDKVERNCLTSWMRPWRRPVWLLRARGLPSDQGDQLQGGG